MDDAKHAELMGKLAELAAHHEYAHAIAWLCLISNYIIDDKITMENSIASEVSKNIIRKEISILIFNYYLHGEKNNQDTVSPSNLSKLMNQTEKYLKELHDTFNANTTMNHFFYSASLGFPLEFYPEIMFYTSDSASSFQYQEIAVMKYKNDDKWLMKNKGFNISQLIKFIEAIYELQILKMEKLKETRQRAEKISFSILPIFLFSIDEIAAKIKLDTQIVKNMVNAFCINYQDTKKQNLVKINDFNPINAYPIIEIDENNFLLFQILSLRIAIYETPHYWLMQDTSYQPIASENRGDFAEALTYDYLVSIFGAKNVYKNIEIYQGKQKKGEIDVLVKWGNILCIFEVKTKLLTVKSRLGDEQSIIDDFKSAVVASYKQAHKCANLLLSSNCELFINGVKISSMDNIKEIYLFPVVADDYPALTYLENQFLEYSGTDIIQSPYVMDVFLLQSIKEILKYPLYFFDFIDQRLKLKNNVLMLEHESAALSYYLQNKLKKSILIKTKNFSNTNILESASILLIDLLMRKSRETEIDIDVPNTIFDTHNKYILFKQILQSIENSQDYEILKLGVFMLSLSDNNISQLEKGIKNLLLKRKNDAKYCDAESAIESIKIGFYVLCTNDIDALSKLKRKCESRKYINKCNTWYGLCIDSKGAVRCAIYLNNK